jgi:ABC-2 type transport system ATP-binding protein
MPIVETKTLTRLFGSLRAVDGLSISVEPQEVFGLLGPNGAGKTTTIKMLTTLLPPTSGIGLVAGFNIQTQPAQVRRKVGYVPQFISADGTLSGYENLLIFAKLYDLPHQEREKRIHTALAFMGLEDAADKMVRQYSGGMIRRLEIAQSILHRPEVLFLDEPTVGLDPNARRIVWAHIKQLQKEFGTTILLTTHVMEEADSLCDRVAIMNLGIIAAIGSPAVLKKSIHQSRATLDDVFIHYTGNIIDNGGNFRETARTRRTARRLG